MNMFEGLVLLACAADAKLLDVSCSLYNSSCLKPTLAPSYDIELELGLSLVGALNCRRHHRYARGICMAQGSCHALNRWMDGCKGPYL